MCEHLYRNRKKIEVISSIKHLKNFHEKREDMGTLTILLV